MLGFTKTVTLYHQKEDGLYICRTIHNVSVSQTIGIQPSVRRVSIPGRHSTSQNAICVRILDTNPMRYCEPYAFDELDKTQYTASPGDILCIGQGPQELESISQLDAQGFVCGVIQAVEDLRQSPLGHVAIHSV